MEPVYNLKYLVNISLHLQAPQNYYRLYTWERGWPWNRKIINGVTSIDWNNYDTVESFLNDNPNYVIAFNEKNEKNIYLKPYVHMTFLGDNYNTIYFDTKEDATEYYDKVLEKIENKI